jgi:anti-anti-sigma regulatory factor
MPESPRARYVLVEMDDAAAESGAPLQVTVKRLDDDSTLISVCGPAPAQPCPELDEALTQAEEVGTPGLVIDLSELEQASAPVVSSITRFQEHCLGCGRWLLVVPPSATLTDYLLKLN